MVNYFNILRDFFEIFIVLIGFFIKIIFSEIYVDMFNIYTDCIELCMSYIIYFIYDYKIYKYLN